MMSHSLDDNFLIFNPDTYWNKNYINEINKMQDFYFKKKLENLLLLARKDLSFDKNLRGDFELKNNIITTKKKNSFLLDVKF